MRNLYITRGIPGCGKSTLLKQCGLDAYALEPDAIRLQVASPTLGLDGTVRISQENDRVVWKMLYETLERRMQNGELVVVDATHLTARYYQEYANLARAYRYQTYVIDVSHIPLEQALTQNTQRAPHKIVSEAVVRDMYARLKGTCVPKGWTILTTPQDIADSLAPTVHNFSSYNAVHHIGDIQGCFAPLEEYFTTHPYCDTDAYVFTGDLLDRGPDNDKVLAYIIEHLSDKPNVFFVEGNHDSYIWQWIAGQPVKTREFTGRTQPQLEAANLDRSAIFRLMLKMTPYLHYTFDEKTVLITHGGLSTLPQNITYVSARQAIRGVGTYEQSVECDNAFVEHTDDTTYQIHGHRNSKNAPTQVNQRCYNLEGQVEFGSELRTVTLNRQGFTVTPIANPNTPLKKHPETTEFVRALRANSGIRESRLADNISSFHFKPEVFYRGRWSAMTIRARGLFINTLTNHIVARAYDKFFNVGERRQTEYCNLAQNLTFPVTAYVKENGYLGLLGYDAMSDELVFASKSTTEGEFARWFKELFIATYGQHADTIKTYLRDNNLTLVFEVIKPHEDPHIINYQHDALYLLEAVYRQKEYRALPYDTLTDFARTHQMAIKQKAATFDTWEEFDTWYQTLGGMDYQYDGRYIEGFVLEDAANWHVKIKLDYYTFWKQARTLLDRTKTGKKLSVPAHCKYPEMMTKLIDIIQSNPDIPSLYALQEQVED